MIGQPIHSLAVEDALKLLETSPEGLDSQEAAARLSLYGQNIISEQRRKDPLAVRFAVQLFQPLVGVLSIIALLFLVQGDAVMALVILTLAVANSIFAVWREYRAEQAVEKLQQILPVYARVLRDGEERNIPAADIVVGDVLVLAEGDNIPADARVIEEYGLRVNNATLTGEVLAARKIAEASLQPD
ncbi:MAG: cation-transporting P-type ATPase, partial [Anaerolineales bacterium]